MYIFSSCDATKSDHKKNPLKDNFSKKEAQEYLSEVAQKFSPSLQTGLSKQSSVISKLSSAAVVSQLKDENSIRANVVLEDVPEFITIDGRLNRINIECINPENIMPKGIAKGMLEPGYGVYTDPDLQTPVDDEVIVPITVYYEDGENITTQVITWNLPYAPDNDDIASTAYPIVKSYLASVTYPLYAISVEESQPEIEQMEPGTTYTPTSSAKYPFFMLHEIRLHETRDWLTKDEFESWYGYGKLNNGVFNGYEPTHERYKHNDGSGEKTKDYRGKQIRLKDVNVGGKNYTQSEDFAMFELTNNYASFICPFEDDLASGEMARDNKAGGERTFYIDGTYQTRKVDKNNWDAYNVESNKIERYEFGYILDHYVTGGGTGLADEDDRYSQGAIYAITKRNMEVRTIDGSQMVNTDNTPLNGKRLDDVKWVFGMLSDYYYSSSN